MDKHSHAPYDLEQYLSTDEHGDTIGCFNGLTLQSVFQPIYRSNGTILGFEALTRATTEDGQMIKPSHLFRCLEKSSPEFTNQINLDTLTRLVHIRNFAPFAKNYSLFLNLLPSSAVASIESFTEQHMMVKRLEELGISRHHIVLEVMEHQQLDTVSLSAATHQSINAGFQIAIDDFGVDGSEEARVKMIQPCLIKIDRSMLLRYLEGEVEALLRAIALGNEVCAEILVEGIETQEEYDAMRALKINYFQGFYLGEPKRLEEFLGERPNKTPPLKKAQ